MIFLQEPNNIELVGVQSLENENSNLEDIPRREFRPRKPAEKPKKVKLHNFIFCIKNSRTD